MCLCINRFVKRWLWQYRPLNVWGRNLCGNTTHYSIKIPISFTGRMKQMCYAVWQLLTFKLYVIGSVLRAQEWKNKFRFIEALTFFM